MYKLTYRSDERVRGGDIEPNSTRQKARWNNKRQPIRIIIVYSRRLLFTSYKSLVPIKAT